MPMVEFLMKWNAVHQFFLKDPISPQAGMITVPDLPGLGMELDDSEDRESPGVELGADRSCAANSVSPAIHPACIKGHFHDRWL